MQPNNSTMQREEVRTFWTGPVLSYYEILSLKSFVATGARVFVYSYEKDLEVPDGAELVDAAEILSGEVHDSVIDLRAPISAPAAAWEANT